MIFRALAALCLMSSPAIADIWSFNTPSGNIECSVGEDFGGSDIICTIFKRSAPMAQFNACPVNSGITVSMLNKGSVDISCAPRGARALGGQSVADYGVKGEFGGFTCLSSTKGLDCRNEDGHGFFLSRKVQNIF